MLLKQTGLYLYPTGSSGSMPGLNSGFYITQDEAELQRTSQMLQLKPDDKSTFLIYNLDIPNPAYEGIE